LTLVEILYIKQQKEALTYTTSWNQQRHLWGFVTRFFLLLTLKNTHGLKSTSFLSGITYEIHHMLHHAILSTMDPEHRMLALADHKHKRLWLHACKITWPRHKHTVHRSVQADRVGRFGSSLHKINSDTNVHKRKQKNIVFYKSVIYRVFHDFRA